MSGFFGRGGEHAQKLKLGDGFFSEKKTVQFLVSLYCCERA